MTNATGAGSSGITSLAVGHAVKLSMTPVNDGAGTGVDWSVTCGGSPLTGSITGGACGTLSPAHTPNGAATVYTAPAQVPIGTTVTVTAAVTSDPSATSSVALTITPPTITIAFLTLPPASLTVNSTLPLGVQLVGDITGQGVTWTCVPAASCGSASFMPDATISNARTTFTAPAAIPSGGMVTVTATSVADPTQSQSASITILPAPPPITVTVSPTTFTVGEDSTIGLTGAVANDASNQGLTWTVTCAVSSTGGSCGTLNGIAKAVTTVSGGVVTYQAPSSFTGVNPVTITATAAATLTTMTPASVTAAGMVTPGGSISVSVTGQQTTLPPLGSTMLTATVSNGPAVTGVTWAVCAACGTITNEAGSGGTYTATYTAPAVIPSGGDVVVSASATPAPAAPLADNPGLAAITIAAAPPSIAYLQQPPATLTSGGQTTVSATVTNDVLPGGVTWTTTCGSTAAGACGYVQPYQTASATNATYVAPPVQPPTGTDKNGQVFAAGQIAIVAASTANPKANASALVTITQSTALSIRFVPSAPSQIQAGTTVNLQAAVSNDVTGKGVDWQVCSGCGYFTVKPAIPAIPATPTTPFVPAVPAVTAPTVSGWPNNLPIPYTAPVAPPSGGPATITALADADSITSAVASVLVTSQATGPELSGHVLAGMQPIQGSSVSLYVAGSSGYGSAATLLYSPLSTPVATTTADGSFTISSGYTCPAANSQAYLVAAGGQTGAFGFNEDLTLMTALGPCINLSSTPVVVNEVTTVASAWSLSHFAANDELTGNSSYLYLGSDSANTIGLANAFASVNNLVDITTGQALFTVPAGNASVPYAEINTLADILNACTDSAGGVEGDGSACSTLLTAADTLGVNIAFNPTSPKDTVQAAFNIVQHPSASGFLNYSLGIGKIFALAAPGSPFQPILNTSPNDFSLSLNYAGGGGLSGSSEAGFFALDGSGNLWITDTAGNSAIEWNNTGTPVSTAGYTTASLAAPGPVAIDASGDVWICDSNGLTELNSLGTEQQGSPFVGGGVSSVPCQGLAFDGLGNLWVNNSRSVSKFTSLGVPLSPSTGYTIAASPTDSTIVPLLSPIAIDDSDNIWVGVLGPAGLLNLAELNNGTGLPNYLNGPPTGVAPYSNYIGVDANASDTGQEEIAINAAGDVWVPSANTNAPAPLGKILPYEGPGTTDGVSAGYVYPGGGVDPFTAARGVAIDGAGLVWTGSTGTSGGQVPLPAGLVEISSSNSANNAYFVSPSLSNRALVVSVDGSGNIWVLLDNDTVTEYVGLATPAVTPLAAAVKNKKLGAEP